MQIEIMSESTTAIIDTHGAELVSLKDVFGTEYIWSADKKYWGRHSPILFPIIGVQKNHQYEFEGKTYNITNHGFIRDSDFEVVSKSKDNCLLSFSSNEKTKECYPFDFKFQASFLVEDSALKVKYTVLNMDNKAMYFNIGGHTGYNIPLAEDETFEEYRIDFDEKETFSRLMVDENCTFSGEKEKFLDNQTGFDLKHELFDTDAIVPDNVKSKGVTMINRKTGHGVHVNFEGFENLAIWSEKGNTPFVCLEPWNGRASSTSDSQKLIDKHSIIKLDTENSYSVSHTITLL